jgi:uncharacterized protein YycO
MDNPILKIMQGDNKPNPDDVSKALADTGDQSYNGWCQAFVEQVTGSGYQGDSAISAWNNHAKQGRAVPGTQGLKAGDPIYFTPNVSNNNDGHVGIFIGNNKFVSATDNGVKVSDIPQWQQETGQQVLGFIPQTQVDANPILSILKGGSTQ